MDTGPPGQAYRLNPETARPGRVDAEAGNTKAGAVRSHKAIDSLDATSGANGLARSGMCEPLVGEQDWECDVSRNLLNPTLAEETVL